MRDVERVTYDLIVAAERATYAALQSCYEDESRQRSRAPWRVRLSLGGAHNKLMGLNVRLSGRVKR